MKKKFKKRGISLIVLVITIIVIIILAAAVILTLTDNNPISNSKQAAFLNDLDSFKSELEMYKTQKYATKKGDYNPIVLQADEGSLTYNGEIDTSKNIYTAITSLKGIKKYEGKFVIVDGQLVYIGKINDPLGEVAETVGVKYEVAGAPKISSALVSDLAIESGTDALYTIQILSSQAISEIDNKVSKIKLIKDSGEEVIPQPVINIEELVGNTATLKRYNVKIVTSSLLEGTYKLKIEEGIVKTTENMNNDQYITLNKFDILDNVPPVNPIITSTPLILTKNNVTVNITYTSDSVQKLYSLDDGSTWQIYNTPLIITENNKNILAKAIDNSGNQSGNVVKTISNIDRIGPTVEFGTNGENNISQVSTNVKVTDPAGINTGTLNYKWDTQDVTEPINGWITFSNNANLSKTGDGTYYLWIKANDSLGNSTVIKSNMFKIQDVTTPIGIVQTENKTFTGEITGFSYNNPVIPAGFRAANTRDANWSNLSTDWNKGLVIIDNYENEFVWVPINGGYSKWCLSIQYPPPSATVSTLDLSYNTMGYIHDLAMPSSYIESSVTTKYGGFYVARYEAGFDYNSGDIRAISKKSSNSTKTDWSTTRNINYQGYLWNFLTQNEAKNYAENMDAKYNYDLTKCGTNLISGVQWDSIMKWLKNSSINVSYSNNWGNYVDSIAPANVSGYNNLQVSGYSSYWKSKNIYDLAGNIGEVSNESYYSGSPIERGSLYTLSKGASLRHAVLTGSADVNMGWSIGFRVVLHVI